MCARVYHVCDEVVMQGVCARVCVTRLLYKAVCHVIGMHGSISRVCYAKVCVT